MGAFGADPGAMCLGLGARKACIRPARAGVLAILAPSPRRRWREAALLGVAAPNSSRRQELMTRDPRLWLPVISRCFVLFFAGPVVSGAAGRRASIPMVALNNERK